MKTKKTRGFTLIELLIVIVILGLLLSLVAPDMFSKVGSTKLKTAAAQMDMMSTALDTYRLDVGDYPENLSELRSSNNPKWDGPYLRKDIPQDPWGRPYVYTKLDKGDVPYALLSYGRDGRAGGEGEDTDVVFK